MTLDEPHILVVDDDKRLRDLLRKYLMDNGFRVTVAMEAEDARARLQAMEYDLIVLEGGVDDYLTKPFEPRELLLRITTILRRVRPAATATKEIRIGDYLFDPKREILSGGGSAIRLTSSEASLLTVFADNAGTILSREDLTQLCEIDGSDRMIDVQVTRLRRKIEPDAKMPRYLKTVRGRGYVLWPD